MKPWFACLRFLDLQPVAISLVRVRIFGMSPTWHAGANSHIMHSFID